MALVDFDVLDGVDEFLEACALLGLRAGAGMETRVFVPEFAEDEINSPGEPGVAYQIGVGFVSSTPRDAALLDTLKRIAQQRTRSVLEKVNTLLAEIALDYEADVLPLTPRANPTERHLCAAYDAKARERFGDRTALVAYWAGKLGLDRNAAEKALESPPTFQGVLRAKTMKAGGVGYIQAKGEDFPALIEVNRFVLANGAIPTFAFLDGTSPGEQRMDDLLDVMIDSGVAAVNIIPDRNWNIADADVKATKLKNLDDFIRRAQARHLPIIVGTEMNAHGQRFVDDFDAPELKPYYQAFAEGMFILYAHTRLQAHAGMGYLSPWATQAFASTAEKNRFFVELGRRLDPKAANALENVSPETSPREILRILD